MVDRAIASMPILTILVAGALTKIGYFDWGLAWIAGLCALLIMADLGRPAQPSSESGRHLTNRNTFPDRPCSNAF